MSKTSKSMKKRLPALIGFALLLICLTACAGLKPFPEKYIYEFDPKEPVCGQYQIVDQENLKYEWVKDIPFKQCPAIFGFTPKQIPNVLNWARDAKVFAQEHCH